jgi:D-sedoheptulose 7-phosphate isomerase
MNLHDHINNHISAVRLLAEERDSILALANRIVEVHKAHGTVYIFGNGGSAADSQHFVGELVGRFSIERTPLRAVCLNSDTSVITCIANDYSYENVFSRQVQAFATPKDLFIGFSTSAKSKNVIQALRIAKDLGAEAIMLTGNSASATCLSDLGKLQVMSSDTAIIQECQKVMIHAICYEVDRLINE